MAGVIVPQKNQESGLGKILQIGGAVVGGIYGGVPGAAAGMAAGSAAGGMIDQPKQGPGAVNQSGALSRRQKGINSIKGAFE